MSCTLNIPPCWRLGLVYGAFLFWAIVPASAATVYFESTDGYASEPANWSSGALPTAADTLAMTNLGTNVMRIQDGDNLSVSKLSICRNFNGTAANRQIIRQTGGVVAMSGGPSVFASWPNDSSDYWLSSGTFRVEAPGADGIHFSGRGIGAFNMDGGELFIKAGYPRVSGWAGRGALDVRGGVVNVTNAIFFAIGNKETSHAILTIGGTGTFRTSTQLVTCYDTADPTAYLNVLEGGTLAFPTLRNPKTCTTYCNLAGGVIEPFAVTGEKSDFITNVNLVANSGGARFNTAGCKLHVRPSIQKGSLRTANLHRRWSFKNGSLADSIVGATGSTHGDVTLANGMATLPGDTHGTSYVTLQGGGDILPTDYDGGITLEFWARPSAIRYYQRVFRIVKGSNVLYLSFNKGVADGSNLNQGLLKYDGTEYFSDNPSRHWTLGDMHHFAAVLKKSSESAWTLTFYLFDSRNGIMRDGKTINVATAFDPAAFNGDGADFSLGLSNDGADDAAAAYDEVRVWKRALTRTELTASATMGPDADLDASVGLRKDGAGTLVLNGANDYAGATIVSNGTLSLGAEIRPYHRWSFNGTLEDSEGAFNYLGRRDAKVCGTASAGITLSENCITLPGGANGTAYVRLAENYGNAIPTNSADGVTVELWARQDAIKSWSRIFNFANNTSYQTFMAWTVNENINQGYCRVAHASSSVTEVALGPWTLGTQFHIAMVAWKDAGDAWKVTYYKHDASTGELLGSCTLDPPSGWSLHSLFVGAFDLGRSASGDPDAAATYDEVRVWGRPFTAADLAYSAKLGPDRLPSFPATAASPATLPATTDLTIATNASLCLSGAAQTVKTLSGSGVLVGTGSLSATDGIFPGTDGTAGRLTIAGGVALSGTLTADLLADGTCDTLVFAPGTTYDISGLALAARDPSVAAPGVAYTVLEAEGATLTGAVDTSRIPPSLRVTVSGSAVTLEKITGCVIMFR